MTVPSIASPPILTVNKARGRKLLAGYVLLGMLLLCQVWLGVAGAPRSLHGRTDFRAFYGAGKIVSLGQAGSLYSYDRQAEIQRKWISANDRTLPFLYPAFAAPLFVPFSFLRYGAAFLAFACLNVLLLLFFSRWAWRQLGVSGKNRWLVLAFMLCYVPVLMALLQGQISFALLCIFAAAHSLSMQKKDLQSGAVLSLTLVKFQLGIPVLVLFACWKRWRVVGGMLSGALLLAGVSVLIVGPAGVITYLHGTATMAHATAASPLAAKAKYAMFPSDMPNLHGLCFVLFRGGFVAIGATIAASVAAMVVAARRPAGVPAALCVAMLVSYHMQPYDMTLLLLPITVAVARRMKEKCILPEISLRALWNSWQGKGSVLLCLSCVMLVVPFGTALVFFGLSWVFVFAVAAVMLCLRDQEQNTSSSAISRS